MFVREKHINGYTYLYLVENGTHVLFGARPGRFADGETTLAHDVWTCPLGVEGWDQKVMRLRAW